VAKKNRPEEFFIQMEELLGSIEAGQLVEVLLQVSAKSVRYNRNLCVRAELKGVSVPWCVPYGRYWDGVEGASLPSRTIDYAAGKYYIQEASAMLAISVAERVIDFNGKKVLDLTAAPGGKTTQVAELLGTGYLVANEVVRNRLDALIWNINRHRLNNVIVTSLATDFLAQVLPGFFDIVIVDAPCSGEGLFQKRKNTPLNWSVKNVRFCARRQQAILIDAQQLIKPEGYLIYSTCTFSQAENEAQVAFLLQQGMEPVSLPGVDVLPVSAAITDNERVARCSRRIFPHREKGAGAFVSILRNSGQVTSPVKPPPLKYYQGNSSSMICSALGFLSTEGTGGFFYEKSGIISYFSHDSIPAALERHTFQIGAPLIDKRRDNELMFGCAQFPASEKILRLERLEAEAYIRGEDLPLHQPDGYYFVAYDNMVLGPVRIIRQLAANKFPRPLRTLI